MKRKLLTILMTGSVILGAAGCAKTEDVEPRITTEITSMETYVSLEDLVAAPVMGRTAPAADVEVPGTDVFKDAEYIYPYTTADLTPSRFDCTDHVPVTYKQGFIDEKGTVLTEDIYSLIERIPGTDVYVVAIDQSTGRKYGLISIDGKKMTDVIYDEYSYGTKNMFDKKGNILLNKFDGDNVSLVEYNSTLDQVGQKDFKIDRSDERLKSNFLISIVREDRAIVYMYLDAAHVSIRYIVDTGTGKIIAQLPDIYKVYYIGNHVICEGYKEVQIYDIDGRFISGGDYTDAFALTENRAAVLSSEELVIYDESGVYKTMDLTGLTATVSGDKIVVCDGETMTVYDADLNVIRTADSAMDLFNGKAPEDREDFNTNDPVFVSEEDHYLHELYSGSEEPQEVNYSYSVEHGFIIGRDTSYGSEGRWTIYDMHMNPVLMDRGSVSIVEDSVTGKIYIQVAHWDRRTSEIYDAATKELVLEIDGLISTGSDITNGIFSYKDADRYVVMDMTGKEIYSCEYS